MPRPQQLALALATVASLACSSNSKSSGSGLPPDTLDHDASAVFAGAWYGTVTVAITGAPPQSDSAQLDVSVTGRNALTFPGFCGDGKGPPARVTSDSAFVLGGYACPIPLDSGCTVTWQIDSGSGALSNGQLTMSATGTAAGCGISARTTTLTFSGNRTSIDHGPPIATVTSPVKVEPGAPVTLDASASADPDGRALTFSWVIAQQPYGASATLIGAATATPTFSSSVLGTYTARVTVTASDGQSATADVTVQVAPPALVLPALPHRVAQAAYSASLERIVMTDGSPNALYVYDPATGAEASAALALPPQCLTVSPDGKFAVVGHNAWISYVDLTAATVVKTIPVSADIGDCVLGANGWAYLFPRVDQWVTLHSVELATGVEVNSGTIYAGYRAALSPSDPGALYAVTSGLSPAQLHRWDVSGGAAAYKWESPYWGNYPMGPAIWFSADGARLLTASGTAFRTSPTQSQDLQYAGQLSGLTGVKHLHCSSTEIAAIPATYGYPSTASDDTTVELFDPTYLGHQDRISLPWWVVGGNAYPTHGLFVFHGASGAGKYVIVQADGSSGLLHDTTVLTY